MLINWVTNRWLQECVHLTVFYKNGDNELAYCRDGSLVRFPFNLFNQILLISNCFLFECQTFDPNFAEGLKFLNISYVPAGKWNDENKFHFEIDEIEIDVCMIFLFQHSLNGSFPFVWTSNIYKSLHLYYRMACITKLLAWRNWRNWTFCLKKQVTWKR